MYNETGVWVAVDLNGTGTLATFVYDAAVAINYSNVTAVSFNTRLGGNISRNTTTPEGYPVFKNGSWVFIDMPGAMDVRFVASSAGVPGNATTNTTIPFYMLALRESLNWSLMLNTDPDDDGLTGADDPCPFVFDCDGDGIGDGAERANGTNATNADTDGDGLWDGPTVSTHIGEWVNGSNPRSSDTDLDGLLDGPWNATTGQLGEFNASTDPTEWDTDGDGMADPWEIANGLNATNAMDGWLDKDKDGLNNTLEYSFSRPDDFREKVNGTWWNGTNGSFWDTDGDGMPDGWEQRFGLDPLNATDGSPDVDLDNLNASAEYHLGRPGGWNEAVQGSYWNGSNPMTADTDGDGIADKNESTNQTADVDADGLNNWLDIDSDGDALLDAFENAGWDVTITASPTWWNFTGHNETLLGTKHVRSNPYSPVGGWDNDGDGLADRQEFGNLTDPNNADSDYDGFNDSSDLNKTSVENIRPIILGMTLRQFRICNENQCDSGDPVSRFLNLDYPRDVLTSTFWYEVTVQVSDNAGVAFVEVSSVKLGTHLCDFKGAPPTTANCTVYFATDISGQSSADFSNLWTLHVVDRNGLVSGAAKRTGWGLVAVAFAALPWYVAGSVVGPFFSGVGVGAMEGATLFGFGFVTTGLPFLEWLMSGGGDVAGEKTQFGVAIIGFLTTLVQLHPALFLNMYQEQVYQTAMTESIVFNPYLMNDADHAAVIASSEAGSRDPLINHLWNATTDSLCGSICGGPGNTSDWARFTAGHAEATVAVELALFVITMGLGASALGRMMAKAKAELGSAPKAGADALAEGIKVLPKLDLAEATARASDPAYAQARDLWIKLGEQNLNVEFGAVMDSVTRLGIERAAATWNKLFNEIFTGERPMGMLRQKPGAEEGVLELDPAHQALFDSISEVAGIEDALSIRNALKTTSGYDEFWLNGIAKGVRPGLLPEAADLFVKARKGGMSTAKFGAIFSDGYSAKLLLTEKPVSDVVMGRRVEVYGFMDSTVGRKGAMLEERADGTWRYDGLVGTKGLTWDNFKGKLTGGEGLKAQTSARAELRDLMSLSDAIPKLGEVNARWTTNVEKAGPDILAENADNPNGAIGEFDGGHGAKDLGAKLRYYVEDGGKVDPTTNEFHIVDTIINDFIDVLFPERLGSRDMGDAIRIDPETALPEFVEGFMGGPRPGSTWGVEIGTDPMTGWVTAKMSDGLGHHWWLKWHFQKPPPV